MAIELNHHAAVVVPYHRDGNGKLHFIFEAKDPNFRTPYFDNGLNFLGGNSVPADRSSKNLLFRELAEEFWRIDEPHESLNALLGQHFSDESAAALQTLDQQGLDRIGGIYDILVNDLRHAGTYNTSVLPPITKAPVNNTRTVFVRTLTPDEFEAIGAILTEFGNKVTPDNLRFGGAVESISLDEINARGRKFAWGYCRILNDMLERQEIPCAPEERVLRPLSLYCKEQRLKRLDDLADPAKADVEALGFTYNPRNW